MQRSITGFIAFAAVTVQSQKQRRKLIEILEARDVRLSDLFLFAALILIL